MKKYKIDFRQPAGNEGDLCFYSNSGIDTYRSGCKHDCLYCYARSQNKFQYKNWNPDNPSILDVEGLRKQFINAFETDKRSTKVTSILRDRIPIRIGMNSDPFNPCENDYKITYETLKIFKEYNYPFLIFTKSDLVARDDYIELYQPDTSYFQMTVTTINDKYASKMEQNAPSPRKRINAIAKLNKLGFKTAFRINPLFPIYPDGYFSGALKGYDEDALDYFTFELIDKLIETKPHCIIVGFLRVCNSIMHEEIKHNTGMDLKKYFLNKKGRYFSADEIRQYYKKIKDHCDKKGVNFSVCFDTNDNYEKFKDMWANPSDCCCAKGMISGFKKTALDAK